MSGSNDRARLVALLDEQGRKRTWLAARMGTSPQFVTNVLNGHQPMTASFLERACAALGITVADLMASAAPQAGSEEGAA